MKSIGHAFKAVLSGSWGRKKSNNRESSRSTRKGSAMKLAAKNLMKIRSASARSAKKDTILRKEKDSSQKLRKGARMHKNSKGLMKKAHSSGINTSKQCKPIAEAVSNLSPCFLLQWIFLSLFLNTKVYRWQGKIDVSKPIQSNWAVLKRDHSPKGVHLHSGGKMYIKRLGLSYSLPIN